MAIDFQPIDSPNQSTIDFQPIGDSTPQQDKGMAGPLAQAGKGFYETMHQIPGVRQFMDVNPELKDLANEVPEPAGAGQRVARMVGQGAGLTPVFAGGEALAGGRLIGGAAGVGAQQTAGDLQEGKSPIEAGLAGAESAAGTYVGGKVLNAAGEAIGNAFKPASQKISDTIGDLYSKAIKPTIVKGNQALTEKANANVEAGVRAIIKNKDNLKLGDEEVQIPETISHTSEAIAKTKDDLFNQYNELQKQATGKGVTINGQGLAQALQPIINDKALDVVAPQTKEYAVELFERLQKAGEMSPEEAQEMIKGFNGRLKAYYRNPSPDQYGNTAVDALVANNARKVLDDAITNAGGAGYQALKNQYGALSSMEKDVARAAQRASNYQSKGLLDFSDILTGEQVARGILTGNPAEIATGTAGRVIKEYYKKLNSPDANIKGMFQKVNQYMQEEGQPSLNQKLSTVKEAAKESLGGLFDAVPYRHLGMAGRIGVTSEKQVAGEADRMIGEGGPAGQAQEPLPFGGAGEVRQKSGLEAMNPRSTESTSPISESFSPRGSAPQAAKKYEQEHPLLSEKWKNLSATGMAGAVVANAPVKKVDVKKVSQIESSGNKYKVGDNGKAVGLNQIHMEVLSDFNKKTGKNYTRKDLINADKNNEVADWYLNEEIPRMIKAYGKQDTVKNRIIAYNAGIKYIKTGKKIPKITENYLKKYGL